MGEKLQSTQGRKEEKAGAYVKRGRWGSHLEMMERQRRGHSGDLGLRENKQRASYRDTGINCNPLASQARSPALKTGGLPEDFPSHTGRE